MIEQTEPKPKPKPEPREPHEHAPGRDPTDRNRALLGRALSKRRAA
jgi:hypothetical protein